MIFHNLDLIPKSALTIQVKSKESGGAFGVSTM